MSDLTLIGVAGCLLLIIAICIWALAYGHRQDRKLADDWNDRRRRR